MTTDIGRFKPFKQFQSFKSSPLVLPASGEDEGGGLNVLNDWNDWNGSGAEISQREGM
jgi:hypothetical protein